MSEESQKSLIGRIHPMNLIPNAFNYTKESLKSLRSKESSSKSLKFDSLLSSSGEKQYNRQVFAHNLAGLIEVLIFLETICKFFGDLIQWKRPFYTALFGFLILEVYALNCGWALFITICVIFMVLWGRFLYIQISDSSIGEFLGTDPLMDQEKRLEQNLYALTQILVEFEPKFEAKHFNLLFYFQKISGNIWWAYSMLNGALDSPFEVSKVLIIAALIAFVIPTRWIVFFSIPAAVVLFQSPTFQHHHLKKQESQS
jgi:hypothetical protein